MKLSVLVPAYNLQDYIAPCLLSVLQQSTDFDFEVIVCDDASTDNTATKIAELALLYPHKLRPIYKQKNAGLAANMLTLLNAATGQYIAYLDGDDIALPTKLQKQVDHLDQHQDCQMVYHESDMFDSLTDNTIKLYSKEFYNWSHIPLRSNIEHMIRYGTYMQASSVMFRNHKNLQKTVSPECKIIFDYAFYINNAGYLAANIDFIPEVLGRYRIHENSFGQQTSRSYSRREQSLRDIEIACMQAAQFGVSQTIIDAGIAHHRFAAALYFLARGAHELFIQYIEMASSKQCFFNSKHQAVYENRHDPAQLKQLLSAAA
ncbi:glycosyltransferase [uncultured Paraglaciecola sp.]|uniref:glycosyltransferase family 2 protein n=1 Tax=uncultured Paraglaciecola sp. TaxID=1765024 RepID=UPI0030D7C14A|tara:strand:- start:75224 stop:76177 length:954 start_codon:yes stop_codon:yes gene_type:complete